MQKCGRRTGRQANCRRPRSVQRVPVETSLFSSNAARAFALRPWQIAQTGRECSNFSVAAQGRSEFGLLLWPPVRPGGLCLNGGGYAQDQAVGAAAPHQLQPQRQPLFRPAARDRDRRLAGEVERPCKCPAHLWVNILAPDLLRTQRKAWTRRAARPRSACRATTSMMV